MDQGYTDHLDLHRRGRYVPYLKEHRLIGSTPVTPVAAAPPIGTHRLPPMSCLSLGLATRASDRYRYDVGAGTWSGRLKPGHMSLAPPHVASEWVQDRPFECFHLGVPFAALRPILEEASPASPGDFGRLYAAPFRDPLAEAR